MKKFAVIGCILIGVCASAGEGEEIWPQDPLEKFVQTGVPQDIRKYMGQFFADWKLQSTIDFVLPQGNALVPAALSFDGSLLVAVSRVLSRFFIFNTVSGVLLKEIGLYGEGHAPLLRCTFNREGTKLVINGNNHFHIISIDKQKKSIIISDPLSIEKKEPTFVTFNPHDSNELLCASREFVLEVRDSTTGQIIRYFAEGSQSGPQFCLSPDGNNIVLSGRQSVTIWDIKEGTRELEFPHRWIASGYSIAGIFYTRDGNVLVVFENSSGINGIRLFDVETGERSPLALGEKPQDIFRYLVFLQQKNMLMMLGLVRWDIATLDLTSGQYAYPIRTPHYYAPRRALSANKNGTLIAFGDRDGNVFIWNSVTKEAEHVLSTKDGSIMQLLLSDDGKTVIAQNKVGEVYIWRQHSYSDQIKEREKAKKAVNRQRMRTFLRDLQLIELVARKGR